MRQFDQPGRSPVYATQAMVASSHPLASSTALRILHEGGNAVDAAIAANAVLSVVEPQMTGIGGDCFALVAEPNGQLHALNGSGRAPAAINSEIFRDRKIAAIADNGPLSITVPGAVKAWETLLAHYGTMEFAYLLDDAIRYARDGFVLAPRVARDWQVAETKLASTPSASKHYLRSGKAPQHGEMINLPALAETLSLIADQGSVGFYTGAVAEDIAQSVQGLHGVLSEEDLANVKVDWVTPISTQVGEHTLYEIPPNGQGLTALVLVKLLNSLRSGNERKNSVERVHLEIECARIAYAVRDAYVADPAAMNASVSDILSDSHLQSLAALYQENSRNKTISLPELPNADTVYLSVVDKERRAVSFINSIYSNFGSGVVSEKTGVVLQNRGACFNLHPDHANEIGPSKRPMHTIIPAMVMKKDKVTHCFGVMGGAYQPLGHAHVLSNLLDYAMDPQQALDHPRVFWGDDGVLELESGAHGLAAALEARGHQTRQAATPHGGGQIIQIKEENGVLVGGSDPRKDGQAQGY